jgi:gluconate 2-dehydrogenase gamma chain
MTDEQPGIITRRAMLRGAGIAVAAGAVGTGAVGTAGVGAAEQEATSAASAAAQAPPTRIVYEQLTAEEGELLEAIADQLIPDDEQGPGAIAAGAVIYIDRALGGALTESRDAYRSGLAAFDRYCRSSRGAPFSKLIHGDQISALIDVETGAATGAGAGFSGSSGAFFAMVRNHVIQGTFGDPYYGGNRDFIGWDMVGYPGVRIAVTPELQRQLERGELQPNHNSAYETNLFEKAVVSRSTGEVQHGD